MLSARSSRLDQEGNVIVMALLGVLALGLGIGLYVVYDARETVQAELDKEKVNLQAEQARVKRLSDAISEAVPWIAGSGQQDLGKLDGEALSAQAKKVTEALQKELVASIVQTSPSTFQNEEQVRTFLRNRGVSYNIQAVLDERKTRIEQLEADLRNAQKEMGDKDKLIQETQERTGQSLKEKEDALAKMDKDLNVARNEGATSLAAMQKSMEEMRTRLEQEKLNLDLACQRLGHENSSKNLAIESLKKEINKYKQGGDVDIKNLTIEADGRVLEVDQESDVVVVDIGGRQRVREGMSFDVYWKEKGGMPVWKGKVQITQVQPLIASGRIVREKDSVLVDGMMEQRAYDPSDPITPGCFIDNPWFKPGRKAHFSLVGDFRYHTRDELKRLIEEDGTCQVVEKLSEADFIVLGIEPKDTSKSKEFDTHLGEVRVYGAAGRVMREEDVMRLLRNYKTEDEIQHTGARRR